MSLIALNVIVALLAIAAVAKVVADGASQGQVERIQRDSCSVFEFVAQRFTVPTKTETPAQKQITAAFALRLDRATADCARAGEG